MEWVTTQEAHSVAVTSDKCRCDMMVSHRRCYDVILAPNVHWVWSVSVLASLGKVYGHLAKGLKELFYLYLYIHPLRTKLDVLCYGVLRLRVRQPLTFFWWLPLLNKYLEYLAKMSYQYVLGPDGMLSTRIVASFLSIGSTVLKNKLIVLKRFPHFGEASSRIKAFSSLVLKVCLFG